MTIEEKNIKICEWLGWTEIRHNPKTGVWYGIPPKTQEHQWDVVLPNHFKDLNAIFNAEQFLTDDQEWGKQLALIAFATSDWPQFTSLELTEIARLPASHRAQALGLTLKLWDAGE